MSVMGQLPDTGLPIEEVIDDVRTALGDVGLGVLVAEPGAGKTTVVPLRLLHEPWLADQTILVLEPRRVAARAVARRMAHLLGESVGETVGWRTRDDTNVGPRTRIEVITEGILTRRIQRNPTLPGVGVVLFDEFHERSIHADLGLALALEVRTEIRPDLRILVMSATIDADAVATMMGDGNGPAPVIECAGRTYPIDIQWHPRSRNRRGTRPDRIEPAVVAGVQSALEHPGDVLVFLPGVGEIRRVMTELTSRHGDVSILALYGALSSEEQDAALRPTSGQRRVVVATDVAETSLTVDGVGSVVDSGLARRPRYDPATGLSKLVTIDHSRASADQRAGRAGRLGPGVAIRLWSKIEHAARPKHDRPEIQQVDVASLVLEALAWGVRSPADLRLLDQPTESAVEEAFDVLAMLGAVDADRRITPAGAHMLALPMHPRLAAMVAAVGDGPLGWPAAILAALIGERDVITGRPSERPVDLWPRVQLIVDEQHRIPDADGAAIRSVRRQARDIARRTSTTESPVSPDDLGRCLSLAYPDRIAQKRAGQGGRFRLRNGMGAEIDKSEPLAHEDMIVIAELSGEKRNIRIRRAAAIAAIDVEMGFGSDVVERTFEGWDDATNDLVQRVERRLGALDFGTHERRPEPSTDTTAALVSQIIKSDLGILSWTERARSLQARAALVAHHRGDVGGPDISDVALLEEAEAIFGPWLDGARGRADLESIDIVQVLQLRLGWDVNKTLDELAPPSYSLPSGRKVAIDYLAESPRISIRVQETFGIIETPTLVGGLLQLTFELLSPANRPIQITSDLAAFWQGSWQEVRKEMAGRYPKHDWDWGSDKPGE